MAPKRKQVELLVPLLTTRVEPSTIIRLDTIVLQRSRPGSMATRADLVREALEIGLAVIEQRGS